MCKDGITPADAGKTLTTQVRTRTNAGSPPRMRGKPQKKLDRAAKRGDHPRGCGENRGNCTLQGLSVGSPPRMRGKQRVGQQKRHITGITPADAGKTINALTVAAVVKDHPRGCGENPF